MMIAVINHDGTQLAVNVDDVVWIGPAENLPDKTEIKIRHEEKTWIVEGKFLDVMNVLNEEQS